MHRLKKDRIAHVVAGTSWTSTVVMFAIGTAIGLGLGAYLFQSGEIGLGTVYLIYSYASLIRTPLDAMSRQLDDLQKAAASLDRIDTLLKTESVITDGPGLEFPEGALAVSFRNVTFSYQPNVPVLTNVSFEIEAGTKVALVGRSGAGKTTMAKLLCRLYDPDSGIIRVGGRELPSTRLSAIRQRIAIVTQNVQLIHGTLRDNLALFNPNISDEYILSVISDLGLWDWFKTTLVDLNTHLDSRGGLSSGEAQLVAFIRIALRNPGVVILDEATSRLDPGTEKRFLGATERLLEGRTGLIIAHRLATLHEIERWMVLQNGEIAKMVHRGDIVGQLDSYLRTLFELDQESCNEVSGAYLGFE